MSMPPFIPPEMRSRLSTVIVAIVGLCLFLFIVGLGFSKRMLQEYQDELIAASDRRVERLMDSLHHMTYKAEDCTYTLDPTITPSEWEDNLIHDTNCLNPLHWSHVLQDTSWYAAYRRSRDSADSVDSIYKYEMRW